MPQRCLEFVEIERGVIIKWLPNTACTRRVGVCAFLGCLRGWELVPAKRRPRVPPTRG